MFKIPSIELLNFRENAKQYSKMSRKFAVVTAMLSLARSRNHGACSVCSSKMAEVDDEVKFLFLLYFPSFFSRFVSSITSYNCWVIAEQYLSFLGVRSLRNNGFYDFVRMGEVCAKIKLFSIIDNNLCYFMTLDTYLFVKFIWSYAVALSW